MAECFCSSFEADNSPLSSSDLSAESVGDADGIASKMQSRENGRRRRPSAAGGSSDLDDNSSITSEPSLSLRPPNDVDQTEFRLGRTKYTTSWSMDSSLNGWTDDKHRSYLNSIEATFVKSMYDREYCALDICGQTPQTVDLPQQDAVEFESVTPTTSWSQEVGGCYPVSFTKPPTSQFSVAGPRPGIISPWIKRHMAKSHPRTRHRTIILSESFSRSDAFGLEDISRVDDVQLAPELIADCGTLFMQSRSKDDSSSSFNLSSSKQKIPSTRILDLSCSNSGTLKHRTSKETLARDGLQMDRRSLHDNSMQEHQGLSLNTELQLCCGNWEASEKSDEKIASKEIDSQTNKGLILGKHDLEYSPRFKQDHLQPTSFTSTSISMAHLSPRKRRNIGMLVGENGKVRQEL